MGFDEVGISVNDFSTSCSRLAVYTNSTNKMSTMQVHYREQLNGTNPWLLGKHYHPNPYVCSGLISRYDLILFVIINFNFALGLAYCNADDRE